MTTLIFLIVCATVIFLVGLGIGLLHSRVKPADAVNNHNAQIKEITTWLRREKDQLLNDLSERHTESSPASATVVKIADEIEKRFMRKGTF